ncbi:MAG: hypothetical protein COT71_01075 [Candidatus Andersenbacteria bacterium CG10_big_fil_rev_8_21_14_0_10_54_11]|uniref:Winged helix-turn helix domain-containing protein n=1 Tax=Candidatus Andersenbacteria bacterium CG10_big_fil_rev_8_21_14_0_10_54_11 TaxID=1974485 RepID=A0A2M6X025_9BACT|nr:MAG: hypothetical protein COT71_01075 [Candidatus Andersenbacteria bacterium CG10_big_fil_rev_8_21_14_0_10_54_11]
MRKHTIKLSAQEKHQVKNIMTKGEHNARVIKRVQMLLASHRGSTDADIAKQVGVAVRTVERVRQRYATSGLDAALYDAPRPGATRKLTDKAEACFVALACTEPPAGHQHWKLTLLRQQLIDEGVVQSVSTVTLWNCLTDRGIKPWREKNVVHSEADRLWSRITPHYTRSMPRGSIWWRSRLVSCLSRS